MDISRMEFARLLEALLQGEATSAEIEALNRALLDDAELRTLYCDQIEQDLLLRLSYHHHFKGGIRKDQPSLTAPARCIKPRHHWLAGIAAAAAVLMVVGLAAVTRQGVKRAADEQGWGGSELRVVLSQRHRDHGGGRKQRSELSRGGFTAEDAEGRGENLSQRHGEHGGGGERQPVSSEQLVVSSGMGILPMIPAQSPRRARNGEALAAELAAVAPLHRDPIDQTDPSDPTDHSRDPSADAAALAAEPRISAAGTEPAALAPKQPAALAPRKEEEAGMTATQKLAAAVSAAALTGMAGLDPANVTDVTITQQPNTRIVQVSYTTDGPGIATCRFYDAGEPIGVPGMIRSLYGDIHQLVNAGTHEFTWNAGSDRALPEQIFSNLTVEVTLWATNNPPEYCAVHLMAVAGQYPVRWYGSENEVPFGVTNDSYKTTYLLLRKIPSTEGEYVLLGSLTNETSGTPEREGKREVRITTPFYMGVYQVTQSQYTLVGAPRGSFTFQTAGNMRPAENVSYYDLRESKNNTASTLYKWPNNGHDVHPDSFMGILRNRTGGLIQFDLPTDAQWEYACRAGTFGPWNNGSNPALLCRSRENGGFIDVGGNLIDPDTAYEGGRAACPPEIGGTALVGSYLPNAWGLYDMHGNILEWCLDWFSDTTEEALPSMSGDDPEGPVDRMLRILRGGYWGYAISNCRSAFRDRNLMSSRSQAYGFRVAAAAVVTP